MMMSSERDACIYEMLERETLSFSPKYILLFIHSFHPASSMTLKYSADD